MDPYVIEQLMTARRDDLVREADEARLARDLRDETPREPAPGRTRTRRLGIA